MTDSNRSLNDKPVEIKNSGGISTAQGAAEASTCEGEGCSAGHRGLSAVSVSAAPIPSSSRPPIHLPCPFCGSQPRPALSDKTGVVCKKGTCPLRGTVFFVDEWNARQLPTPDREVEVAQIAEPWNTDGSQYRIVVLRKRPSEIPVTRPSAEAGVPLPSPVTRTSWPSHEPE